MKRAYFRWYLKKRLTESTASGTLNLKKLAAAAEQDEGLRVSLALYLSAYLTWEETAQRLDGSPVLKYYGKYYYESGIPGRDALRAMPEAYHRVYDDYIRYTAERRTNVRIKAKCRKELLSQMERQSLSQREVGRLCAVDFACISRFLQGGDYALSAERLKSILDTLRGMERIPMRKAQLYIDDYNETALAEGMIEISFTLNISEDALASLRRLCTENNLSFPTLLEKFLIWLITDAKYAGTWVREQQNGKEST